MDAVPPLSYYRLLTAGRGIESQRCIHVGQIEALQKFHTTFKK